MFGPGESRPGEGELIPQTVYQLPNFPPANRPVPPLLTHRPVDSYGGLPPSRAFEHILDLSDACLDAGDCVDSIPPELRPTFLDPVYMQKPLSKPAGLLADEIQDGEKSKLNPEDSIRYPNRQYQPIVVLYGWPMSDTNMKNAFTPILDLISPPSPASPVPIFIPTGPSFLTTSLAETTVTICEMLSTHPNISTISKDMDAGIKMIGYGIGAIVARALVEKCPNVRVTSLVSMCGPQMGVTDITPLTCFVAPELCANGKILESSNRTAVPIVQDLRTDKYSRTNFINDLNNLVEHQGGESYRLRMLKLDHLVLVACEDDEIIRPWHSALFGIDGQNPTMEHTELYKTDTIGLRALMAKSRIHRAVFPGNVRHDQVMVLDAAKRDPVNLAIGEQKRARILEWYGIHVVPFLGLE